MYLHLGENVIVPFSSIIGIFDLDNTSQSKITRTYLANEERVKHVINVSEELPRSFIVCRENDKTRVYISQISSATLQKRTTYGYLENKL